MKVLARGLAETCRSTFCVLENNPEDLDAVFAGNFNFPRPPFYLSFFGCSKSTGVHCHDALHDSHDTNPPRRPPHHHHLHLDLHLVIHSSSIHPIWNTIILMPTWLPVLFTKRRELPGQSDLCRRLQIRGPVRIRSKARRWKAGAQISSSRSLMIVDDCCTCYIFQNVFLSLVSFKGTWFCAWFSYVFIKSWHVFWLHF